MANDINIDSLSIEIKSNADKAVNSLDKLADSLDKLSVRVNSVKGMAKISSQIERLSQVAARANPAGLEKLAAAAERVSKITIPNFTRSANSLSKLTASINGINSINDMSGFQSKIGEIISAVKPLETLGKNTLSPFITSLKAIPTITNSLDVNTLNRFKEIMLEVAEAIEPLAKRAESAGRGLEALNGIMRQTIAENGNLASSNAAASKAFTSLINKITSVKAKIIAIYYMFVKVGRVLKDFLAESNAYVENLNLFTVAMGSATDSALEYADAVNKALGIDQSEWIRNMGVFKSIETGFGTITEKANLMAKNLTQIGYDIASFYNINVDEAMQKVQSGISGELEPLRRLGYALDAATLQQIAYDNGIQQNINTMTQAQKSQLRYIAIMKQSKNVMGDMSRTISTPANAMRVLGQQMTQMQRALGNIISVFAVKLIPYLQAAVRLLTDLFNYLADMLGFELPEIDYSGMEQGITGLSEDAEEATDSVNETAKAVQRLAGFDEINVLKSASEDADGIADTLGNQFDLGIDLPEYDFLQGASEASEKIYQEWKKKLKELYDWWKKHKKIIKEIAKIMAALWVVNKIKPFIDAIGNVVDAFLTAKYGVDGAKEAMRKFASVMGTVVGTLISARGTYKLVKEWASGTMTLGEGALYATEALGGLAIAFAFGGFKGAAIALIVDGIMAIKGACDAAKESADKALDRLIAAEWQRSGESISDVADKLTNFFDKTTESEKKFLDESKKLEDMRPGLETLASDVKSLIGSLDFEELDLGKLDELKTKFNDLAKETSKYVEESTDMLTAFISANSELLRQQGINAGEMITYLRGAEGSTLNKIEDIQAEANAILEKGTAMTEQDQQRLTVLYERLSAITGISGDETAEELNAVSKAVKELSNVKINPENIDTAYSKITEIASKYGEAYNTIAQAKEKALAQLDIYDWSSPEEKQAAKDAINAIYQGKLEQLRSVNATIQNIGGQIADVWADVNEDINTGTVAEWSWLNAIPFGIGKDYSNMKDKEAIQKAKADLKKEYGTFYTDPLKYIEEQFNLNAGGATYGDMIDPYRNYFADINLKDITAPNIRSSFYTSEMYDLLSQYAKAFERWNNAEDELKSQMRQTNTGVHKELNDLVDKMEKLGIDDAAQSIANDIGNDGYTAEQALSRALNRAEYFAKEKIGNTIEEAETVYTGKIQHFKGVVTQEVTNYTPPSITPRISKIFDGSEIAIDEKINVLKMTVIGKMPGFKMALGVVQKTIDDVFSTDTLDEYTSSFEKAIGKMKTAISQLQTQTPVTATVPGLSKGFGLANLALDMVLKKSRGYATGGMPTNGDFFFANENGKAEFISSVGSRPAVANQDQMRAEMRQGVKEGVIEALAGRQNEDGDIYIILDGDQIAYSVEKRSSRLSKRTGGR